MNCSILDDDDFIAKKIKKYRNKGYKYLTYNLNKKDYKVYYF